MPAIFFGRVLKLAAENEHGQVIRPAFEAEDSLEGVASHHHRVDAAQELREAVIALRGVGDFVQPVQRAIRTRR